MYKNVDVEWYTNDGRGNHLFSKISQLLDLTNGEHTVPELVINGYFPSKYSVVFTDDTQPLPCIIFHGKEVFALKIFIVKENAVWNAMNEATLGVVEDSLTITIVSNGMVSPNSEKTFMCMKIIIHK